VGLPRLSCDCTVIAEEHTPAVSVCADVVKTSLLAAAVVTEKLLLAAPVSAPSLADRVKVPALVGTRLLNVATPATAATVVVEAALRTPPLLMTIETLEVSVVTTLPN